MSAAAAAAAAAAGAGVGAGADAVVEGIGVGAGVGSALPKTKAASVGPFPVPLPVHLRSLLEGSSPLESSRTSASVGCALPDVLTHKFRIVHGHNTKAAADDADIAKLFPKTFGQAMLHFVADQHKHNQRQQHDNAKRAQAQGQDPAIHPEHVQAQSPLAGERLVGPCVTVGIVLSGGPAPGGHNVICGLFDFLSAYSRGLSHSQLEAERLASVTARSRLSSSVSNGLSAVLSASLSQTDSSLRKESPASGSAMLPFRLLGFLDGPDGVLKCRFIEITNDLVSQYRNSGGFHMIGSGRTKIESAKDLERARETMQKLQVDGLVVTGGDDSNTNAAVMAEYFLTHGCNTRVVGVAKTIDGDLKSPEYIETSFGFDTATRVYSERVGALCADAASAKKCWHFCRLMGRSASHVTLECALQTHPNLAFIGEEVHARKLTMSQVVNAAADVICRRAELKKNYGVILIPEGLIDFVPDFNVLIAELNELIVSHGQVFGNLPNHLSTASRKLFQSLPIFIQQQLLLEPDPHGNIQLSHIESERLLMHLVKAELHKRKLEKRYTGSTTIVPHFLGYDGRCGLPSDFDCSYCFTMGWTAGALIAGGYTGVCAAISNLTAPVRDWHVSGLPLTQLMNIEHRRGKPKPVIRKALVDLQGLPFLLFHLYREEWELSDDYRNPGAIQYAPAPHAQQLNLTLQIEALDKQHKHYAADLRQVIAQADQRESDTQKRKLEVEQNIKEGKITAKEQEAIERKREREVQEKFQRQPTGKLPAKL